jgi:Transcriptional regulator, AbiEi antitoxin, Type IV TA system
VENVIVTNAAELEQDIIRSLKDQNPFVQLLGVEARQVSESDGLPFDVKFELRSGDARILVYGEIKPTFSPKQLADLKPWIQRLESIKKDAVFAVIAPTLSTQAQNYCLENEINFLDLAGNISINVPGKFVLQRTGMRDQSPRNKDQKQYREANVFSGRFSRVVRVLLEKPRTWTLTEIAAELDLQSTSNPLLSRSFRDPSDTKDFRISLGSISKALTSLEEQLLIRRRNSAVLVPEPQRLLKSWAEKYRERYRWRLLQSFRLKKPIAKNVQELAKLLLRQEIGPFAVTGPAAASFSAPFVDIGTIDIFLPALRSVRPTLETMSASTEGPEVRFVEPYDLGVFLYSKANKDVPVVSNIQAYLDLYARGGRDQKQATYLLENAIIPGWLQ